LRLNTKSIKIQSPINEHLRPIVALPSCSSQQLRRAILLTGTKAMTRPFRILLAAFASAFAMAGTPPASAATVTLSDPNCDSFTIAGGAGSQTLTCVVSSAPVCTVVGPTAGSIGTPVALTAQCSPAATSWAWTGAGNSCEGKTTQICQANEPVAGPSPYKVQGRNANGWGPLSAAVFVTWSSGPSPAPAGCVASITTNPSPLTNAGGTATVSVTGCSPAGVTYNWSKNGAAGWSTSASPAADTLGSGGTAGFTNSYQVQVCNGGTCINVPASNPLTAFVPGSGGGGGGAALDMSSCTQQGLTGRLYDLPYSTTANINDDSGNVSPPGSFGNSDVIVVRFTVPANTPIGDLSSFQTNPTAGYPYVNRIATLSTDPFSCLIATSTFLGGGVIATIAGTQTPLMSFAVGGAFGRATLLPGATYYITYVNRNAYGASAAQGSCTAGDCKMDFHFQN
jgi:hypothetical protein